MIDKRDVSLENVPNVLQFSERKNDTRLKYQEMDKMAPMIAKTIIDLNYHLTSDVVNYWYFDLPIELRQFSKEQLSLFLVWLNITDPCIITTVSTDSSRSVPNKQFQTSYGVTFDMTFNQRETDVCVYKNAS